MRKDIPLHAQLVQSAHAALELGFKLDNTKKPDKTSFLILLEAKDQNELFKIKDLMDRYEIDTHMFYEPDYDMGYTAICTEPIYDKRNLFKKFNLWKP